MSAIHQLRHRNDRGIALVLTLAFLALITVTVLAFFSSVTTEMASSKSYAAGASAKELSDSAVSAVIGTIKEATSGGSTVAWTSQPGLLRTYDDTGKPIQVFKLYSSDTMVESSFDPTHDVDVDWKTKPGYYVDLNQPINRTTNGTTTLSYPIADPAAADPTTGVEGFSLTNAPGYDASKATAADNNPAPMPVKWIYVLKDGTMTAPDKYDAATGIASFTTGAIPTGTNPIVGRMAFWTDDETAKVNINTASEGTFADIPICNTQPPGGGFTAGYVADSANNAYEFDLTEFQGANKEYQRYPGHPATTCLSTIFGKSLAAMNPALSTAAGRPLLIQLITDITPRVTAYDANGVDNSSKGGTRRSGPPGALTEMQYAAFRLSPDKDRLYASVDELMFKPLAPNPNRTEQPLASGTTDPNLPKKVIEQSKFFVTAQSRAPELNIFNKPRVAIWPLQVTPDTRDSTIYRTFVGSDNRTYFDKLIAFCSSIGVHGTGGTLTPYYFDRQDPTNATKDWSARNQAIYKYLQALTSANAPGFGKNFAAKYTGGEIDQILTEIFDYIRCTNLIDYSDSSAANAAYTPTNYTYKINPATNTLVIDDTGALVDQNVVHTRRGQVVPIAPPAGTPGSGSRGIGRIATISEMALVAIRTGPRKDGAPFNTVSPPAIQDDTKTDLQIALIPELFCPMAGYSALANDVRIRFKNISIKVDGAEAFTSPYLPNQNGLYDKGRIPNSQGVDRKTGGCIGYMALMENSNAEAKSKASNGAPADSLPAYANITIGKSSAILMPLGAPTRNMNIGEAVASGKTMTLGGSVDVEIETPGSPGSALVVPADGAGASKGMKSPATVTTVQKFHFDFPTTTVPIPNRVWVPTVIGKIPAGTQPNIVDASVLPVKRGGRIPPNQIINTIRSQLYQGIFCTSRSATEPDFDVVRSVAPSGTVNGDIRLISATGTVPSGWFIPSPKYSDVNSAGVHSMRQGEPSTPQYQFITSGGGQIDYAAPPAASALPYPRTNTRIGNGAAFGSLLQAYPAQYPISTNAASATGNYYASALWNATPPVPEGIAGVKNSLGEAGDWDNGPGLVLDGPLCNKADEGADRHRGYGFFGNGGLDAISGNDNPYLGPYTSEDTLPQYASFFSPNKMMPSPVMFGSLPTGVKRGLPWQTLLFRPAVSYLPGNTTHPGGSSGGVLPDHLLLDLFWMPVVDPYAISEPMATAGKINLNYQIVPFSHIKRDTGLRAVLKSVKITAINPKQAVTQAYNANKAGVLISDYKRGGNLSIGGADSGGGLGAMVRYNVDPDETLGQFETMKFSKKLAFISASEICDIPLVPKGTKAAGLSTFWANNTLTGDNSLEKPYCHMYSRLTTKSNTYTVHMWVEVLRPVVPRGAANNDAQWAQFNEKKKEQIISRYRGSTLIERYIDPQDPALANFDETYNGATVYDASGNITKAGSLDPFYKFHVLSTKKFGK